MTGETLEHLTAGELVTLTLPEKWALSHPHCAPLLPSSISSGGWMDDSVALSFCPSLCFYFHWISLSLSLSALWFVASLCFLPPEKVVLRNMSGFASLSLFCQDACYPAVERSSSLSVSCFLPIYFSPPSHIQKSKTNRPPQPSRFSPSLSSSLSNYPPALFLPLSRLCPAKMS